MGIVVSSKVGNAVVRNLVRRRLRHALRAVLPVPPAAAPAGVDLLVICRPEAAGADFAELNTSLIKALGRSGLT